MDIEVFDEAVGKIMGVKQGQVLASRVAKNIDTGEWRVLLDIRASKSQAEKLFKLSFQANNSNG